MTETPQFRGLIIQGRHNRHMFLAPIDRPSTSLHPGALSRMMKPCCARPTTERPRNFPLPQPSLYRSWFAGDCRSRVTCRQVFDTSRPRRRSGLAAALRVLSDVNCLPRVVWTRSLAWPGRQPEGAGVPQCEVRSVTRGSGGCSASWRHDRRSWAGERQPARQHGRSLGHSPK